MNLLEQSAANILASIGFLVKPAKEREDADPPHTIYSNFWIILEGRRWQLDFVLLNARIAIEIQGSHWHGSPGQTIYNPEQLKTRAMDKQKAGTFRSHGWQILCIPEEAIEHNDIQARLRRSILLMLDI